MFVFVCILFILILIKWYLVAFYQPQYDELSKERFAEIEYMIWTETERKTPNKPIELPKEFDNKTNSKKKAKTKNSNEVKREINLFEFDPNRLSHDSLLLLGFNEYAAKNLVKYRSKGGRFKYADDLKRVYGLDDVTFEKIKSYVKIRPVKKKLENLDQEELVAEQSSSEVRRPKNPELAQHSIDINLADTSELKKLRGIGTVYANRIVKFRKSLGGYFSIEQINEVWGISDSLYISIKPFLKNASRAIKKKNINSLDKKMLSRHPYVDWRNAKTITSYRKMHGDFTSIDELRKMHGLSEGFIDTLTYYFDVQ